MPKTKRYSRARGRRRYRKRMSKSLHNLNTHYFKRTATLTVLNNESTTAEHTFSLSELPNYTEYTALFDQYSISKIVLKFMPEMNVSDVTNAAGSRIPTLRCVADKDGGGASTFDALGQQTHKDLYLNRPRTFVIDKPAILVEVYKSLTTTGYGTKSNQWIDCADSSVPHYSWKYALYNTPAANWLCPVFATFYFKCKGVR